MFDWSNADVIARWGFGLTILGVVISLGGFWVTIAQLLRTSRATEAVEAEVSLLKNRMAAFDYASECVRASKSLEHATHLLRGRNWGDAAARLLEAQGVLNRVSTSTEGTADSRGFAKQTADQLLISVRELEEAHDKGLDFDPTDLTLTLRKQINSLDIETISIHKEL